MRLAQVAAASLLSFTIPQQSQAYPIDCAILLCLAGGWDHPSAECTAARIEFIRRITPWPIEPPLQIWRCPLGASAPATTSPMERFWDISFEAPISQQSPNVTPVQNYSTENGVADVDISDPIFDFIRSIEVWQVYVNRDRANDGRCISHEDVRVGRYGIQGDFSWNNSVGRGSVPAAFGNAGQSGCNIYVRAVFIHWTDYFGNYGYERVNY